MRHTDTQTDTTPRVFIQCLSCYNAGRITGQWTDLADIYDTWEDIQDDTDAHICSNAEEYMIADVENIPSGLITLYTPMSLLEDLSIAVEKYGKQVLYYIAHTGEESRYWSDILKRFNNGEIQFYGHFDAIETAWRYDFIAENWQDDIPQSLWTYLDIEGMMRELTELGDRFETTEVKNGHQVTQVYIWEVIR